MSKQEKTSDLIREVYSHQKLTTTCAEKSHHSNVTLGVTAALGDSFLPLHSLEWCFHPCSHSREGTETHLLESEGQRSFLLNLLVLQGHPPRPSLKNLNTAQFSVRDEDVALGETELSHLDMRLGQDLEGSSCKPITAQHSVGINLPVHNLYSLPLFWSISLWTYFIWWGCAKWFCSQPWASITAAPSYRLEMKTLY